MSDWWKFNRTQRTLKWEWKTKFASELVFRSYNHFINWITQRELIFTKDMIEILHIISVHGRKQKNSCTYQCFAIWKKLWSLREKREKFITYYSMHYFVFVRPAKILMKFRMNRVKIITGIFCGAILFLRMNVWANTMPSYFLHILSTNLVPPNSNIKNKILFWPKITQLSS